MDLDFIGDLFDLLSDPGLGTIAGRLYRCYMERKSRLWPAAAITCCHYIHERGSQGPRGQARLLLQVEEEVYGATASADSLAWWERNSISIVLTMVFPGTLDTIHGGRSAPGFPFDSVPIISAGDRNA